MKKLIIYLIIGLILFRGYSHINKNSDDHHIEFREKAKIEEKIRNLNSQKNKIHFIRRRNKLFKDPYYSVSTNTTEKIYIGKLKEDKPHGIGIVLQINRYSLNTPNIYSVEYAGYFKDGMEDGYGIKFSEPSEVSDFYWEYSKLEHIGVRYMEYDGYFKNGKFEGRGNYYVPKNLPEFTENADFTATHHIEDYYNSNKNKIESLLSKSDNAGNQIVICDLPVLENLLLYVGKFKKDEYNGKGKEYINGKLQYDGSFKDSTYHGRGTLYELDSNEIRHIGEFKNGNYESASKIYSMLNILKEQEQRLIEKVRSLYYQNLK